MDDGKVQDTLRCVNVGYVGYPLLIGPLGGEVTVQQIFIAVKLLSHNPVLFPTANFRQQAILSHDPQYGFRVTVNPLLFKLHPSVAVGLPAVLLTPGYLRQPCLACPSA